MSMPRYVILCVALGLAGGVARSAPIKPSVVDHSEADGAMNRPPEVLNAIEVFNQGKAGDALALLQGAARRYPHLPPARVMLANLYFSSNQAAAGRQQLERMVAENPGDPEAYLIFGDILRKQGFVTAAAALYAQAEPLVAEFDTDTARRKNLQIRLYSGSAAVAEVRQQWSVALAPLRRWLELEPNSSTARGRSGRALFFMKRPDEAFAQFQAAALADKHGTARPPEIAMLLLYHAKGDGQKAAEWKDKAVQQSPDNLKTRLGVTRWLWETGQVEQARTHAQAALRIDPESVDAMLYCGLLARRRQDDSEAERFFEAAYERAPDNLTAGNQLALVLAGQSDSSKKRRALDIAAAAARKNQQNTGVVATLGWVLYRLGRNKEAAQSLQSMLAGRRTLSRDAAFHVAQVLFSLGHKQEARRLLQTALEGSGPFVAETAARQWSDQIKTETE